MMLLTPNRLKRLIGNPDAYALQQRDGSYRPVREPLTQPVLRRHLRGDITVGTYINHGDQARTLVFDIDKKDDIEGAEADAFLIGDALEELGLSSRQYGILFSGRKGYHVWVYTRKYVSAHDLRRIGKAALAMADVNCEVFPKQDEARDLGNLVKLPGATHRVTGEKAEFITKFPSPVPPALLKRVLSEVPEISVSTRSSSPTPFHCMSEIQEGISEGGRNISLFHFAVMARRGGLNDENVELVVRQANQKSEPPLDEAELQALLDSSKNSGPLCRTINPDLNCGDDCILALKAGLYMRPGQVKYSDEGEKAVVEVGRHTGKTVQFLHPDLVEAKGTVKK